MKQHEKQEILDFLLKSGYQIGSTDADHTFANKVVQQAEVGVTIHWLSTASVYMTLEVTEGNLHFDTNWTTFNSTDSFMKALAGHAQTLAQEFVNHSTNLELTVLTALGGKLSDRYLLDKIDSLQKLLRANSATSADASVEKGDIRTQCVELINQGKPIDAIRVYRDKTGCGLRQAHDYVMALKRLG